MQKKNKPRAKSDLKSPGIFIPALFQTRLWRATVRDVAEHARVTTMTMYRGFKDKDNLVEEASRLVIKRHFDPSQFLMVVFQAPAKKALSALLLAALMRWYTALPAVLFIFSVMSGLSVATYGFPIDDPSAPPNVKYLIQHSDLVCRGHATEVSISGRQNQGSSQPSELRSMLILERCYKGILPEGVVRAVLTLPNSHDIPAPLSTLQKNEHCLFFLVKNGTTPNEYQFISSWNGCLKVSPIVASASANATESLTMLEADLQSGLADTNPSNLRENLRTLAGIGTLRSTDQIRTLAKHSDLDVRGAALLTLLFVHDYSKIQETLDFLASDFHSAQLVLLQNTIFGAFTTITDPVALKALHANVSSHSGRVRSAVVKGLQSIKSPESVPYLIDLLDDPAPIIRYDAVVSLADIEQKGPGWTTNIMAYKQEEVAIIPKWKEWWETVGKNKYGSRSTN
jgi:hypothetical protein